MSLGRPTLVAEATSVAEGGPGGILPAMAAALSDWGPVQELLTDPATEEIWWNDPARIFCSVDGAARLSNVVMTEDEARALVMRAITACGRRVDTSQPFVDAELPDGSRLHVVIPPITRRFWAVNIRRYIVRPTSIADMVALGALPADAAAVLAGAVAAGANTVISGSTHTGKTTMLNALLGSCPGRRVVSCEEVRELRLPVVDWVALQTRDPGMEGTGGITLRDLVREALRMRPDRVVVGEVRGSEALDLILAMNCGIPAAVTIHANSAGDAVDRLVGLPLLAGPNVCADFVSRSVARCLDLVVHLGVGLDGRRGVRQIVSVTPGAEGPVVGRLFADDGAGLRRAAAEIPAGWQA